MSTSRHYYLSIIFKAASVSAVELSLSGATGAVPDLACRWQAAKEDFLRALDIEAAAGADTNAALLNNLGEISPDRDPAPTF